MDENIPTRTFSRGAGPGNVTKVGIRQAQGQVEITVRIATINPVRALGGFAVAFELLVPGGRETEFDIIGLKNLVVVQQEHPAFRLVHDDMGYRGSVIGFEF